MKYHNLTKKLIFFSTILHSIKKLSQELFFHFHFEISIFEYM